MGGERREDQARARRRDDDQDRKPAPELDDEVAFDGTHAGLQRRLHAETQRPGMVVMDEPEHAFEGRGDQDALWTKFEARLDARGVSPEPLALVRDMNAENRGKTKGRLAELAQVVTGGDLLVIAELVSALPRVTVEAALTCETKPTRAQLSGYLSVLSLSDLTDELADRALVARLRSGYPGSPGAIIPQLHELVEDPVLGAWYLSDTPAAQVAMTMVRSDQAEVLSARLNRLGRAGWLWAFHVDEAITSLGALQVETFAQLSSEADVRGFLQRQFDAREASASRVGPATKDFHDALKQRALEADRVVDDLAVIESMDSDALRKPDRRRKFLASASARQIDQATQLAALSPEERMQWLVDGPNVSADELRDVVAGWPDVDRRDALNARSIAAFRARFPGAGPAAMFGTVPDTVYGYATSDLVTRRWIVEDGEARDVLWMLTVFPGKTAAMCEWLKSSGAGYGWLDRIGGGTTDHRLRILALHCPHPEIVERLQAELLGDYRATESSIAHPMPMTTRSTEDGNVRLDRAIDFGTEDGPEQGRALADRTGELTPQDVADLKGDPEHLAKMLAKTRGGSLIRVLYQVEPPMKAVFARLESSGDDEVETSRLGAWLRTISDDEVAAGLADQHTLAQVRRWFPTAPLEMFPQLRKPGVLARVLIDNEAALEWILRGSEPMSALHALGATGVAAATVSALEGKSRLIELFPSGSTLAPRDRTYLYTLYNQSSGKLKQRIEGQLAASESRDAASNTDERATGQDRKARDGQSFAVALAALLDDTETPVADIITLCRERGAEAIKLVDGAPQLVASVIARTNLSPRVLFPDVPLGRFFDDKALAEHAFDSTPGFVILRESNRDERLRDALFLGLDAQGRAYLSWLRQLPTGSGLDDDEKAALAALLAVTRSNLIARELFKCRYRSNVQDTYERREIVKLWKVLERLPSAHREQNAVTSFNEIPPDGAPLDGEYAPKNWEVNIKEGLVDSTDANPLYDRNGPTSEMTRAEAMDAFQLTDEQLDQWVSQGRMTRDKDVYRMARAAQPDRFTGTALHEIGHAVDDKLGSQTDLIYGLAGWKQYGEADFDIWATDLGGWDRVKPSDRSKIREAWLTWINSSQAAGRPKLTLRDFLEPDHPARSPDYHGVGVLDLARGEQGTSSDPFIVNGRAYIMNGLYQMMYSVPLRAVHAAPSQYSMTAPAEYFAECYMAYYLTSDGTPQTASQKGALVAPWIKRWMDQNVDRMSFNPKSHPDRS